VWHAERFHGHIADIESRAGREHATVQFPVELKFERVFGETIAINRNPQLFGEAQKALDVIGVFVGNEDAGKVFRHPSNGFEAFANLAATESGIDQNTGFIGFDVSAVPGRTTAEDREVNSHAFL